MAESVGPSDFSTASLDAYLRDRFAGLRGRMMLKQAVGGLSNPTYFVTYGDWSVVLRKQPAAGVARSAHSMDREFRVLSALQGSAVPVPAPIHYCADPAIIGTPFYLMEHLKGRVFFEYEIPELTPTERQACFDSMCKAMAALHRFDWKSAGLVGFGRPGNYFERQLKQWSEQWQRFRSGDNPYVDPLIEWLRERLPGSDSSALCHGDFRLANLMLHESKPEVIGVLDWELSTIGHPLADVAFNVQAWRMARDENGGIRGLDLERLGIPSEDAYLQRYYAYSGSSEQLTEFHMAFAMFRAAVGSASVAARGTAAGDLKAAAAGRRLAVSYARCGAETAGIRI